MYSVEGGELELLKELPSPKKYKAHLAHLCFLNATHKSFSTEHTMHAKLSQVHVFCMCLWLM